MEYFGGSWRRQSTCTHMEVYSPLIPRLRVQRFFLSNVSKISSRGFHVPPSAVWIEQGVWWSALVVLRLETSWTCGIKDLPHRRLRKSLDAAKSSIFSNYTPPKCTKRELQPRLGHQPMQSKKGAPSPAIITRKGVIRA